MAKALVRNTPQVGDHSPTTSKAAAFTQATSKSIKESAQAKTEVASARQLSNVIDAAGRLLQERTKIDQRLDQMSLAIMPSIKAQGGNYSAKTTTAQLEDADVKRLLPKVKISTLLIQLLGEVETKLSNEGGLFDLMLSLDEDVKSEHLIPLLDAIFDKADLTEKAARLYSVKSNEKIVFTENA